MMVVCVGVLNGRSSLLLIGGLMALPAILPLISRDTVQGSVAGTPHVPVGMIRSPEQIGVKPDGADGVMVKITLHTV